MTTMNWDINSEVERIGRAEAAASPVLVTTYQDALHLTSGSEVEYGSLQKVGGQLLDIAEAMVGHGHVNQQLYVELQIRYM